MNDPIQEIFNGVPELTDEAKQQLLNASNGEFEVLNSLDAAADPTQAQPETPNDNTSKEVEEEKSSGNWISNTIDAVGQTAIALPTGVLDAGVDAINKVGEFRDNVFGQIDRDLGLTNPFDKYRTSVPKVPTFSNEAAQAVREITSVVAPTIYLSSRLGNLGAGAHTKLNWKLGNDAAFQWFAKAGIGAGSGVIVDQTVSIQETDDNLLGSLKKTWPSTYGFISDDWATLDSDSPDIKRDKNTKEGAVLGMFSDVLVGALKLARSRAGIIEATKWVPSNEKAKSWFAKAFKKQKITDNIPDPVEAEVVKGAIKRDLGLDELAAYNLEVNDYNLDQPLAGVHDLYDWNELGTRSLDDFGIVGAAVDQARISNNLGTVYGRVGSVITDGYMKFVNKEGDAGASLLRSFAKDLQDAGEYGYQATKSRFLTHAEIMSEGDELAARFLQMDLPELRRTLDGLSGVDADSGARVLNSSAYAGVAKAIKEYTSDYANMDIYRAAGYLGTSLAGQVSDIAQAVRLSGTDASVPRAQEMIRDRLALLMKVKAQTSYSRGRALNMLNLWKRAGRSKNSVDQKAALDAIKNEKNATLKALEKISQDVDATLATIEAVQKEKPEMLAPLMLAYEMTDGEINSISKLNQYVRHSTGTISKAFYDARPDMPSVWMQGVWSNIYNSVLSAISTPIKAGASNFALMIERPLATFIGAAATGETEALRRASYMYFYGIGDTLQRSFGHMSEVFKRANQDPSSVGYIVRDDIARRNQEQMETLHAFANAKAEEGMLGPQAMMVHVEELNALSEHPLLRFGANAMTALDGFTRSYVANIEAKGLAYDQLIKKGDKIDAKRLRAIARNHYNQMFDSTGMITDKAVDAASREIAMNLDSDSVRSLSALINRIPGLRPFLMFPRTSVNMLKFTGSHNPLAVFHDDLNAFSRKFEEMDFNKVEELLTSRGLPVDENIETTYSMARAELRGRKAIGALTTLGAVGLAVNGSLHGNGHYDKEVQKTRQQLGWKPRHYKGWDGKWYSYENLGALSDWLALVGDIVDNANTLDAGGVEVVLAKSMYLLSANLTNKSFTAGLEPMNDVLSGNPAALSRWGSSFASGLVPGSGLRNEFARIFTPQLKEVEQDFFQLLANRNPILKDQLPDHYDWVDGEKVGHSENFFVNLWNATAPWWKVSDSISPEKQFLMDIEFDARPTLRTNGRGVEYTPDQRSRVTSLMGKDGILKEEIRKIMNSTEGKEFRRLYRLAGNPDRQLFNNIHKRLRRALRVAQRYAEGQLIDRDDIRQAQFDNNELERATVRGDIERIRELNNP